MMTLAVLSNAFAVAASLYALAVMRRYERRSRCAVCREKDTSAVCSPCYQRKVAEKTPPGVWLKF